MFIENNNVERISSNFLLYSKSDGVVGSCCTALKLFACSTSVVVVHLTNEPINITLLIRCDIITGLWQMFNTPIVRFVPILFDSSHCSPYS